MAEDERADTGKFPTTLGESWDAVVAHRDDALLLPQLAVAVFYAGIFAYSPNDASGGAPSSFVAWLLLLLPVAAGFAFYAIVLSRLWVLAPRYGNVLATLVAAYLLFLGLTLWTAFAPPTRNGSILRWSVWVAVLLGLALLMILEPWTR